MKTLAISSVSVALLLAGGSAQAQSNPMGSQMSSYVGGDAMFWDYDPDGGGSYDDIGLRLRGGAEFNEFFALEGHLGTGGAEGNVELDYLLGAYVKGILPVSPEFRLYGLLGITEVDFDRDDGRDVSYGGGAEFDVAPNLALAADYMRYLDKSDYTFDAASVGLRYRF